MTTPASTVTRGLAILVFIGLPALLLTLTAFNLLAAATDRETIAQSNMQLDALGRRLPSRQLNKARDMTLLYVPGASRTSAIADLQRTVVAAVSQASGKLIETAPSDSTAQDAETSDRIRLRATLDIGNDGLRDLLYRLESGVPLIDVETLSIRRLPDGTDGDTERLRIDMLLAAHWKGQGA